MENGIQDMTSLSDYHWLFADELAPEDAHLPPFVPRVLNFEKSAHQSYHKSTSLQPSPSLDERRVPTSPIFRPNEDSDRSCATLSKRDYPPSPQFDSSNSKYCGLKRSSDDSDEEYPRKRRYPRSPVYDPNCTVDYENHAPSPVFMANITSPLMDLCKPKSNLSSWYHPGQSSRELPRIEERHDHDLMELDESKRCIKFLLEEMRTVIESNRHAQDSQITHRTIRSTEERLKSFIQTSHIMSQLIAGQEATGSYVPITEAIERPNPFLCIYDSSRGAPAVEFDPESLPNPFNPMPTCCAEPLPNKPRCDCTLSTVGERAGGSSEIGDTYSSHTTLNYSMPFNPTFQHGLTTQSPVDEDLDSPWSNYSSSFHLQPPLLPSSIFSNLLHPNPVNLSHYHFHSIRNVYT